MNFPGNSGRGNIFLEMYSPKMIQDPGRKTLTVTRCTTVTVTTFINAANVRLTLN